MSIVDDVLKAFDRIPIWRRLQETPREVDELKERVAALEKLLDGKRPAEACPFCGALAFRLDSTVHFGRTERWKCKECGKQREIRSHLTPSSGRPIDPKVFR